MHNPRVCCLRLRLTESASPSADESCRHSLRSSLRLRCPVRRPSWQLRRPRKFGTDHRHQACTGDVTRLLLKWLPTRGQMMLIDSRALGWEGDSVALGSRRCPCVTLWSRGGCLKGSQHVLLPSASVGCEGRRRSLPTQLSVLNHRQLTAHGTRSPI